jgi:L-amino acid N-acyltransferase YncA
MELAMQPRIAVPEDAPAIAVIYNEGIADRTATFETNPRTAEDVRGWFKASRHPIVVVEESGQVIAFARTSPYRERKCYAGIAEFGVYVKRECRGRGAGRMVMFGLLTAAEEAGFWKLLSRIFVENQTSRALMKSVGFREVGVYEKHGRLDGKWKDCVIVECLLPRVKRIV